MADKNWRRGAIFLGILNLPSSLLASPPGPILEMARTERRHGCPRFHLDSALPLHRSRRPPMVIPPLQQQHRQAGGGDPAPDFEIGAAHRGGGHTAEFAEVQFGARMRVALRRV